MHSPVNRRFCSFLIMLGLLVGGLISLHAEQSTPLSSLETSFKTPPESSRPYTWWHWMNGHVGKSGITRDLEAMKTSGLGGFTLGNISEGVPPGPVRFMSHSWRDLVKYTLAEARRLGLSMGMFNAAGWSSSGGPWVTPDMAMQEVVWTEQRVHGPGEFDGALTIPEPALGIERDMSRNPETNKRYYVSRESVRGFYRDIALFAFPTPQGDLKQQPVRLEGWKAKAGFSKPEVSTPPDTRLDAEAIDPSRMIDLTPSLSGDGTLKWKVPPGEWTLLRIGYQPTGRQNHPAPLEGRGLEIDKLSAAAVDFQWKNAMRGILHDADGELGKTFKRVLIDSYEVGHQNWNSTFSTEFRKLRGYDVRPYLPALTGYIVGSTEITEKFLWDFRKTLSDLITSNYYGRISTLCHQNGLLFACEPYGTYGNTDDFTVAGVPDIPMCEWWAARNKPDNNATAKLASSAAHTYGRRIVDSEAFTGAPDHIFEEHPGSLKAQGDFFFCLGVNRFSLHSFTHDPYLKPPGMGLGCYGSRFDSRNTWWPFAGAWFSYLTRCQSLLQQGKFVGDLLYFAGEDAPKAAQVREHLDPPPPPGYDYDFCNRDILERLKVHKGRLEVTPPNGMSYRVLVLPQSRKMRAEVLEKVRQLIAAGAVVVGPKPNGVPGLEGGEGAEARLRQLADTIWGPCDGKVITSHSLGSGRVFWGMPLEDVLKELGVKPDFSFSEMAGKSNGPTSYSENGVEFIHRHSGEADWYFVSNQQHQARTIEATFRIGRILPELWHPETGSIEEASMFHSTDDSRTAVTLKLAPDESVFVVFRKPLQGLEGVLEVEQNGRAVDVPLRRKEGRLFLRSREAGEFLFRSRAGVARATVPAPPPIMEVAGPWEVSFPSAGSAADQIVIPKLISWTESENPGVKYYAGTATYRTIIDLTPDQLAAGHSLILDLGRVEVIARVKLNGRDLGVLWKEPFAVDLTQAARMGHNELEIEVANLWVNRLIGDLREADDCEWTTKTGTTEKGLGLTKIPDWVVNNTQRPSLQRKAFVVWQWPHLGKKQLLPSGLLGPVRLIPEIDVEVK